MHHANMSLLISLLSAPIFLQLYSRIEFSRYRDQIAVKIMVVRAISDFSAEVCLSLIGVDTIVEEKYATRIRNAILQ